MTKIGPHRISANRLLPDWLFIALVISFITLLLEMMGYFDQIDQKLNDSRMLSASREASQQTVILAIDQATISKLGGYPIPRDEMANALVRLKQSAARKIYLDVMFSYRGRPDQDKQLLDAMQALGPHRLALPQLQRSGGTAQGASEAPIGSLDDFTQSVTEVAADMVLDSNGLVRDLGREYQGSDQPALVNAAHWLAEMEASAASKITIDYSIRPETIPVISFVDILDPDFDLARLNGKAVVIGITVSGIVQPTQIPAYGVSPRPHIFALATETLMNARPVTTFTSLQILLLCTSLAIGMAFLTRKMSAFGGLTVLFVVILGLNILAGMARTEYSLELSTAAPVFALLLLAALHAFSKLSIFEKQRQTLGKLLDRVSFGHLHLFEHGEDAILTFAPNGEILSFNASAEELFQMRADQVIGRPISTILPSNTVNVLTTSAQQKSGRLQTKLDDATGEFRHLDLSYSAMSMKDEWLGLVSIRDITELKNREAELAYAASHDALTGLANRVGLEQHYQTALDQFQLDRQPFGLMMFDLDKFKIINDTHGHHVGDCVLKLVAERIKHVSRESDFAARLGGDEFAIILNPDIARASATEIAERLLDRISRPMQVEGLKLQVGVSIGIAFASEQQSLMKEIMHAADMALYKVKNQGRNDFAFSEDDETKTSH